MTEEAAHFLLPQITPQQVQMALEAATAQVQRNLPGFTNACQNHSSVNQFYLTCENDQWTCGFWPGEVWLAYEYALGQGNAQQAEAFQKSGLVLVQSFLHRIENKIEVDHHDMGFLYSPSCVAAHMLVGSQDARRAALLAAKQLLARWQPVGRFLQAWGAYGAKENYRYIIDCMMNLPLLYWAGEQTGNTKYKEIADAHTATCLECSVREDGSTHHTVFMDPQTGKMSHGATCQGYSDDSSWARGQAWGIYGTALGYRHTQNPAARQAFARLLAYYLQRLPQDMVPYWDMIFTSGTEEPRDSSCAAIVACGLLEMAGLLRQEEPQQAESYTVLAKQMVGSLVQGYSVKDPDVSNGQVLHGTYSKKSPYNTCTPEGVDECVSWGDYYYMEALTRLHNPQWKPYW